MKVQMLAAALLLGMTEIAVSADQLGVNTEQAQFDWSGLYVGALAGATMVETRVDFAFQFSHPDPSGFTAGIFSGFNYQMPNGLVLGIDGQVSASDASETGEVFRYQGDGSLTDVPNVKVHQKVDVSGALRARLGYAFGRVLPYVAGGVSAARVDTTVDIPSPPFGVGPAYSNETFWGWTIGGGADVALTDSIILRAEYYYSDLGSKEFELPNLPTYFYNAVDVRSSDIRLGIAYKF